MSLAGVTPGPIYRKIVVLIFEESPIDNAKGGTGICMFEEVLKDITFCPTCGKRLKNKFNNWTVLVRPKPGAKERKSLCRTCWK